MMRCATGSVVWLAVLLGGWVDTWGQETAAAAPKPAAAASPGERPAAETAAEQPGKLRGRLPPYFSQVCDDDQRQTIYAIQAEYAQSIQELEDKLASLRQQRDAKIEAVLRPEQREQLDALRAGAKEKRKQRAGNAAAGSKPATSAVPPAAGGRTTAASPTRNTATTSGK